MTQHHDPQERMRINLPFRDAIKRPLQTPPISDAELLKQIQAEKRQGRKRKITRRRGS